MCRQDGFPHEGGLIQRSCSKLNASLWLHQGSSFFVDANTHLYRPRRRKSRTVKYVYCYFNRPTGHGVFRDNIKCPAFGLIDLVKSTIKLTTGHNHEPRCFFVARLNARNRILKKVTEEPEKSLKQIFNEEKGSENGLIYKSLFWTMRRLRSRNLIESNMQSEQTKCKNCRGKRITQNK